MALGCSGAAPKSNLESTLTKETFEKITNGMSLAEVEALLGTPGSDDSDRFFLSVQKSVTVPANSKWKKWQLPAAGPHFIGVAFVDGKVVGKIQKGL
jgi:hypothetical protein